MASTTATQAPYSLIVSTKKNSSSLFIRKQQRLTRTKKKNSRWRFGVLATSEKRKRAAPAPGVDTRIHWDDPDEGWVGVGDTNSNSQQQKERNNPNLGHNFADLLNEASGSHYQFLGVSVDADMEEIKTAYRRLTKEYHPDTTSLPLKTASEKFMKLRQVYDELSNEEKRRFYDWTLAQEAASRQAEEMRIKLEDPYQQDIDNFESVPDMVDRLGGRNMDLSDQALSALTIDAFIILFAISSFIYVAFFKQSY
ncbi:NAD(P)H-quinone oxidoreductase subunit T, chloroplastic [Euphorbia lathyris]|uniref:NAD(P)H-quinone oxidoreductase subunit T, chloroplastic n=1 Tax=Euphorbia lathyris TaxID=212925 RepID=UPI003313BBA6